MFFTDCDSTGRQTRIDGLPGKIFVTCELNANKVLSVMLYAARNTIYNNDEPENNNEALLFAQKNFLKLGT